MNLDRQRRRDELLEMLWRLKEFYTSDLATLREHDSTGEYEEYLMEFSNNGIIHMRGESIELSELGLAKAEGLVRRHRLAERMLVDVLGKDPIETEQAACEFEHILAPELVDAICTLLGHPKTCPHGIPIPSGPCCQESRSQVASVVVPLTQLSVGTRSTIAFLNTNDRDRLDKLMAMGLVPGVGIKLMQRYPAMVVQVGHSQIAFEESVGEAIRVWRLNS